MHAATRVAGEIVTQTTIATIDYVKSSARKEVGISVGETAFP